LARENKDKEEKSRLALELARGGKTLDQIKEYIDFLFPH
jgi:hypothetical protein